MLQKHFSLSDLIKKNVFRGISCPGSHSTIPLRAAAKCVHKLFHYLLSHNYEDCTPLNLSHILGTYYYLDTITRINFVWSCPLLRQYMLIAFIFDAHDMHISDHNPIITYFNAFLLSDTIKSACACQLGCDTYCIFKFDSISTKQWTDFANELNSLCSIDPTTFDAWPFNQKYEYLHSRIIKAAKIKLPSITINYLTHPTSPDAINQEVIDHFQNFVTSSPPSSIYDLLERWFKVYEPLANMSLAIFDSLMDPPMVAITYN
ncbi:hypothetical protein RhiirC2_797045 [Rhizophagus irregularis]|uniref:Uncharacterized protein n=1 Tax=Rhizophagus irregularis TaxID=588596 RepID=A0A2N1M8P8_9GLOM|nr:hypothetical protein RhiirC2_797045 [Rhizophagus irregularis]